MAIELYDEQIAAIDKLHTGSILRGGVGTGKSRTALAYYYIKVCNGKLKINGLGRTTIPKRNVPLYIITTARKRDTYDWENEALQFYEVHPIVDSWNNIGKYTSIHNAFFIFDEQRVVGYGAWSKAFIKIARRNDWILLSATPGDVWIDYAPVFIANGYYRNITDFKRQHIVYSRFTKYPKIERYVNVSKLEKYRSEVLVNMTCERRTIQHHIDIPVKYDKKTFDIVNDERWNVFEKAPIENASELCLILRRIVNADPDRLLKFEDLVRKNKKTIVFYNFDYELDMMIELFENDPYYKNLKQMKVFDYAQWNGHKHQPIPSTDRWVYLVQYMAGAEAWNCIETNVMIFFSQNYSYKIMEQASGRINRMNTPFIDLYYYHLISNSKIDKRIRKALDNKQKFNELAYFNSR